ncbi:MAG TPA: glycoside hydrolase family 28 protein, partial [Tepidisphaeraceae bacterium]|nr:glycoside hydrolase family 28 protein [Tepidisphaeraceae bacterium]
MILNTRRLLVIGLILFIPAALTALGATPSDASADGGGRTYNLTDYGGVGDGNTINTDAFRKAIETCAANGGGRVRVPAGTFVTGPIQLMSGVDMHVDRDAVVLFSRKLDDYPLVKANWEGRPTVMCQAPISGDNLHDVSFTGPGTFDGSGDAWRMVKQDKLTSEQWDKLVKSGGYVDVKKKTWYPSEAVPKLAPALKKLRDAAGEPNTDDYTKYRDLLRPELVRITNSNHVTLDGPTFRNSPSWNIHVLYCENVAVRNVTLFNEAYAQNGDGIDVDACRNVRITDSAIYAGDDDICLKSGRDEAGRRAGRATENVTVDNCTIFWGHGGLTIGSEMSGGVRNVNVTNCIMRGTDIGLRFKTTRGRGGVVENVNVANIAMHDIKGTAILFDMYYQVKGKPTTEPVSERTPIFRQFAINNVTCQGAKTALEIRGLPELAISDITLEKVR